MMQRAYTALSVRSSSVVRCFSAPFVSRRRGYHFDLSPPPSPIPSPRALHGTTILSVRKGRDVVLIGDGQVSLGNTVVKHNARKVRLLHQNKVIAGFAGSTADCFTLIEHLETKLEQYPNQLLRAAVELAKMWRTDKYLRHLEAWAIAVDSQMSVTITGNGDVLSEPDDGVIGIGSGGLYAVSAARALIDVEGLTARQIAVKAMSIAAEICVMTNSAFVVEQFTDGRLVSGDDKAQLEAADIGLINKRLIRPYPQSLSSLSPSPSQPTLPPNPTPTPTPTPQ